MKNQLLIYVLLISSFIKLFGQSQFSNEVTGKVIQTSQETLRVLSPFNTWLGASGVYSFSDAANLSNNYLISGFISLPLINSTNYPDKALPLFANISSLKQKFDTLSAFENGIESIINSNNGLIIGLAPGNKWALKNNKYIALYNETSIKINRLEVASKKENLLQYRFGLGCEFSFMRMSANSITNRIVITALPVYTFFDKNKFGNLFNSDKSNQLSIETAIIITIKPGVALMVQKIFAKDSYNPTYIGIITNLNL